LIEVAANGLVEDGKRVGHRQDIQLLPKPICNMGQYYRRGDHEQSCAALLVASTMEIPLIGIVNLTQEETKEGTQAKNHVSSSRQLAIASTQIDSSHKPNLDVITVR
jgi:hypothetical protein